MGKPVKTFLAASQESKRICDFLAAVAGKRFESWAGIGGQIVTAGVIRSFRKMNGRKPGRLGVG